MSYNDLYSIMMKKSTYYLSDHGSQPLGSQLWEFHNLIHEKPLEEYLKDSRTYIIPTDHARLRLLSRQG